MCRNVVFVLRTVHIDGTNIVIYISIVLIVIL